jgi:hypothetical protein
MPDFDKSIDFAALKQSACPAFIYKWWYSLKV